MKTRIILLSFLAVVSSSLGEGPGSGMNMPMGARAREGRSGDPNNNPAKVFPDYRPNTPNSGDKPTTTITGRCFMENSTDALQIPCPNLRLAISDKKGKTLFRTETDGGVFKFEAHPGESYFAKVDTAGFTSTPELLGPYKLGEDMLVKVRKQKNSPEK